MKGWNKSGLDSFNNYYKFWRFGINPGLFQQKRTGLGDFDSTCLQLACSTNEWTRGDVVRAARTRAHAAAVA